MTFVAVGNKSQDDVTSPRRIRVSRRDVAGNFRSRYLPAIADLCGTRSRAPCTPSRGLSSYSCVVSKFN